MSYLKGVKKTIELPVVVTLPVLNEKDEESAIEIKPIVLYKRFRRSEARKVQGEIAKLSKDAADAFEAGDIEALFGERLSFFDDLLTESILGWRKMPGEDGDVPFSAEALEEAVEDPAYYTGLMKGLRRALGWDEGSSGMGSGAEEAKN